MSNDELAESVGLLVPMMYLVMLAAEARWPARAFPPRRGWRWVGLGFLVLIATTGVVVPLLLPVDWMAAHRWVDGSRLGVAGGTLAGWVFRKPIARPSGVARIQASVGYGLGAPVSGSVRRKSVTCSAPAHSAGSIFPSMVTCASAHGAASAASKAKARRRRQGRDEAGRIMTRQWGLGPA
jgi:hypothetical protein